MLRCDDNEYGYVGIHHVQCLKIMIRSLPLCLVGCLLLVVSSIGQPAHSQALVRSPQALGMGGAAIAFPAPQSALFYNPAHLTHFNVDRTPITLIGANASLTRNFDDQLTYYRDDLQPALDRGIDALTEEEETTLYEGLFRVGREASELNGVLVFPSFVMNRGSYGLGGGLFARSSAYNRIEDAGAGVPGLDFSAFGDLIVSGAASMNLSSVGLRGLSAGLSGRYTMRYVTLKTKPVDAFDEDENIHVYEGNAMGMNLGLLYDAGAVAGPGRLLIGLAGYNLIASDYDYEFQSYFTKNGDRNDALIADEIALAEDHFQPQFSYRAGAAYVIPQTWRVIRETGFAFDYVGTPESPIERSFLTRLRLGAQTSINDWLFLRAGLNQGYTTLGAGLHLSFVQIDYAFYGREEGRFAGQQPSWHHRVQLLLGSF